MSLPSIESVSSNVHEAWMESKHNQGIYSRLSEDKEELMVPYEQLSEKAKDLDRNTVKAVYAAINATSATGLVDYGQAIAAAKLGKRIAREGWNGKGMFVFLRPADQLPVSVIVHVVKSLPQSVKDFFKAKYPDAVMGEGSSTPTEATEPMPRISFCEYFCMYAADGSIVNGWLASQTDMLATDWVILD